MRQTLNLSSITALAAALFLACGGAAPEPPEPAADVLATSHHSSIDAATLAQEAERRKAEVDTPETARQLLESLAFEDELLAAPAVAGDDEVPAGATAEERRIVVDRYLSTLPAVPPASDAEIAARYETQGERWQRPARRRVSHLFLRTDKQNRDARIAEMRALRQQLLDGASVAALARQHSESQSRHQGGSLGWIDRAGAPPALAEVIFALPLGEPSEPIVARDGVHLFRVEEEEPAQSSSLADAEPILAREIEQERRDAAVTALIAEQPLPEGWELPSPAALDEAAEAAPETVAARLGELEITAGELRREASRGAGDDQKSPSSALDRLVDQERLYQRALATGLTDQPELRQQLDALRRQRLLQQRLRQRLLADARADDDALAELLASRPQRFSSPLQLELRLLQIPLAGRPDGSAVMGRLEAAVAALDAGELELDALATEVGGSVTTLALAPVGELAAAHREIAATVAPLAAGQHSAPRRHDEALVFEVVQRVEPAPLPLDEVRDPLAAALVAGQRPARLAELREAVLAAAGFRVWDEHLASWLAARAAAATAP